MKKSTCGSASAEVGALKSACRALRRRPRRRGGAPQMGLRGALGERGRNQRPGQRGGGRPALALQGFWLEGGLPSEHPTAELQGAGKRGQRQVSLRDEMVQDHSLR